MILVYNTCKIQTPCYKNANIRLFTTQRKRKVDQFTNNHQNNFTFSSRGSLSPELQAAEKQAYNVPLVNASDLIDGIGGFSVECAGPGGETNFKISKV